MSWSMPVLATVPADDAASLCDASLLDVDHDVMSEFLSRMDATENYDAVFWLATRSRCRWRPHGSDPLRFLIVKSSFF